MNRAKIIVVLLINIQMAGYGQAPVAVIDSDRTGICLSNTVTFADSSTNNPTSWRWTFQGGNPSSSSLQFPAPVTYNFAGSFDVTLVVSNTSGSDTLTVPDMIQVELCRLTSGVYRIPYFNGTEVRVNNDHITHSDGQPEYDIVGINGTPPYRIVSARAGIIRRIVDSNNATVPPGSGPCNNNYVWIEHEDGEWSKYTHFTQGSVTSPAPAGAGLDTGLLVPAGLFLGFEGAVGCATGVHLHFEVGVPDDPSNPVNNGGFIIGEERIPIFCDVPGNIIFQNQTYTANPCSSNCTGTILVDGTYNAGDVNVYMASEHIISPGDPDLDAIFNQGSNTMLRSAGDIQLLPGFHAKKNSFLNAKIAGCNND